MYNFKNPIFIGALLFVFTFSSCASGKKATTSEAIGSAATVPGTNAQDKKVKNLDPDTPKENNSRPVRPNSSSDEVKVISNQKDTAE